MSPKRTQLSPNQKLTLGIAALAILATVITAFVSGHDWFLKPTSTQETDYTGRVLDLVTLLPIQGAQVTLDFGNVPSIAYTDNQGVYLFKLEVKAQSSAQVRVDASDYEVYIRTINLSPSIKKIEDIRLTPLAVNPPITESPSFTATTLPLITLTLDSNGMIRIPAGEFMMGSNNDEDEKPIHKVYLDTFLIDTTEVTNAKYDECVRAGICTTPDSIRSAEREYYYGNPEFAHYPVISISWEEANQYCTWRDKRLPTEAEWEKAARGTDGRVYPWGSNSPSNSLLNYEREMGDTTQVGQYPEGASPFGVLDMAGNVWEWVADWYEASYYSNSPDSNPSGPKVGVYHVLRGGSWYSPEYNIRTTARERPEPGFRYDLIGFRCAK